MLFVRMDCVKSSVKKCKSPKFKEIDEIIDNIDSFETYTFKNEKEINYKNQLFSKDPPFELVNRMMHVLINKDLSDNIYFEFSRKNLLNKKIQDKINIFIPELKEYYLKCKHDKYLENLNEKKIITLFRQILKPFDYSINAHEKYNNGEKFLLYVIQKRKNLVFKKIDSVINFD